jgi:SWIM zinc finger
LAVLALTTEGVIALAPDEASAKAARGLISPGKWPVLGANEVAAWGECQGSGSKPYQTQVDLIGPAFRCSCPSRKFPCKHGLALLLLKAQSPDLFHETQSPAWVSQWLESRVEKAQKKEERQIEKAAAPADPQAAAKREAQRWQRMEGATQELQRWLADQLTRGLGSLSADELKTWHTMAARMVDAQAPGLGQRVREAAAGVQQGDDWPERTLARLGLLQLACDAMARRASLSAAMQSELRGVLGWPYDKTEVLSAGDQITDRWTVLGVGMDERDDKLTERRVWLHGQQSGRRALLLEHAFGGRGFEQAWLTGTSQHATLAYFPGASALRVVTVDAVGATEGATWPVTSLHAEWQSIAQRVAASPWVSLHPMVIEAGVVMMNGERKLVISGGQALPLALGDEVMWALLASSGGQPVQLMGEWDGYCLRPLTAWGRDTESPIWQGVTR